MRNTYAVVNQKGGVGKTTTAVNIAAALAQSGRRVLLIDLDPQGNATSGVGLDKRAVGEKGFGIPYSTYDVILDERPVQEAAVRTAVPGLDAVASHIDLAGADIELMPKIGREGFLKRALAPVRDRYDFVFIDSPPSLGLLTINALAAADRTLIPIQCEYYALEGVEQLMRTVELVRVHMNFALEVGLVILTMYDNRQRLAHQVVEEVRRAFPGRVSPTLVPRNVRVSEAPSHGKPVTVYDPRSRGAAAYRAIAEEVARIG